VVTTLIIQTREEHSVRGRRWYVQYIQHFQDRKPVE